MVETVRIKDVTSADMHALPASTPCDVVSKRDVQGASTGVDRAPVVSEWTGLTLGDLRQGDLAYVVTSDPGETAGTVVWWLSEVL